MKRVAVVSCGAGKLRVMNNYILLYFITKMKNKSYTPFLIFFKKTKPYKYFKG